MSESEKWARKIPHDVDLGDERSVQLALSCHGFHTQTGLDWDCPSLNIMLPVIIDRARALRAEAVEIGEFA